MKKTLLCLALLLTLTGCGKSELISEEDFEKGLKNAIKSEANDSDYKGTYKDNKIQLSNEDENYEIDVLLEDEIAFTYTINVKNGMSYDDYVSKTSVISLPMFGYVAAVNTFGIDATDAAVYFAQEYIDGMLSNETESKWIVVYDEAEKDMYTDEYEVITADDFGEYALDVVKDSYGKKIEFTDSEKTFTYELSSVCDKEECNIISKVVVDKEVDYKELKGYYKKVAMESMDSNITPENADINIELNVGQTATLKSKKEISGYGISGMSCYEFSDDYSEIKGIKEGVANGTLIVGDKEKTIYITVVESDKTEDNKEITIK